MLQQLKTKFNYNVPTLAAVMHALRWIVY